MLQSRVLKLSRLALARCMYSLPELPYKYEALEPVINRDIMEIHHSKHHATYVNNLNATALKAADAVESGNVSSLIGLHGALKFNGGGHINHSIFWNNLSPNGGGLPSGDLLAAIEAEFGSFDQFKAKMSAATIGVQGSGWGWLGVSPESKRLEIATCANQDPLLATTGLTPLLGIDVWEHAYYLQYKNVRPEYVNSIWNIVHWDDVAARYATALS